MDKKISELIRSKMDPLTGGLILDPIQTEQLLRWLTTIELAIKQQDVFVGKLKQMLEEAKHGK